MFDGVPIPLCNMLESGLEAMADRLQPRSTVDEMFLAKFRKEHLG